MECVCYPMPNMKGTRVSTRLNGLHMDIAADMGVFGPSSPKYLTRMFAAPTGAASHIQYQRLSKLHVH